MLPSRFITGLSAILVGGAALAAIVPVLPFQDFAVQQSPEHAMVVKGAGDYEGTMTMWMPGAPEPMKAPCRETVTAIGGLWTVSHFQMEFMGQPFSGSAILGFDAEKKKFVGSWIDSMNPRITNMEGEWDDSKKAIVMHYDMFDQMAGEMVTMRSVTTQDANGYTIDFYRLTDDGERRDMQMAMTRKATIEAGSDK